MPANHNTPHTPATKARISAAKKGVPLFKKRRPSIVVDGAQRWRCCTCRSFKLHEEFYTNKRTLLGITAQCRTCHTRTGVSSRCPSTYRRNKRLSEATRRARKASAFGVVSKLEMDEIERMYGSACLKCGATGELQWDHVKPLAKGGAHSIGNLQRLCRKCNERKQAREHDYRSREQKVWALTFKVV